MHYPTSRVAHSRRAPWLVLLLVLAAWLIAACGGSSEPTPITAQPVDTAVVAPEVTVQPLAQTMIAPDPATFSVTASGTAPAYQWQRSIDGGASWVDIAGATASTYVTGATSTTMDGQRMRVVVTNGAGSVASASALLSVGPAPAAPAITLQPVDQSVTAGSAAVFNATATSAPAPALQWQRSTDGGSTWIDIPGATGTSHDTGTTTLAQDGERYRLVASNGGVGTTSNPARLTVTLAPQAPTITTAPANQGVTAPAPANFTALASGVPSPSYQWQLSSDGAVTWLNIVGAIAAGYSTPATAVADSGKRYRVVASNASGSIASAAATLTVTAAPVLPQWQTAAAQRGVDGFSAELAVVASSASGQFVSAWLDTDAGGQRELRSSRYTPGQGWSPAVAVASVTSTTAATMRHAIAMDAAGNALVVFTSLANARQSIWASRQEPSGPWSTPVLLESEDGGHAELPAVAIDGNGVATAVWQQNDTVFFPNLLATRRIVASRLAPNQAWTPPLSIDLAAGGNGTGMHVRVAANSAGDVIASWTADTPIGQVATANVYRTASGWSGAQLLVSGTTSTTQSVAHAVAINHTGNAIVAFRRLAGSASSVYAMRYSSATGWSAAELVGANADAPSVVLAADGTATLVWENSPQGNQVLASRAAANGSWSAPQALSDGLSPQAGIDANGNVTLVWLRIPSAIWTTASARWPAAGALSAATVIETATSVRSTFVPGGLAVSANGDAAAVWVEGTAPGAVPWANVFR